MVAKRAAGYFSETPIAPEELKRAIPTITPDTHLDELITSLNAQEQRMASFLHTYGPNHPDLKGLNTLIETINRQIDDRLDGILQGAASSTLGRG